MSLIATTTEQKQTAQAKLQKIIDTGRDRVMAGLKSMQDEFQIRRDLRVKSSALDIEIERDEKREGFRWRPVIAGKDTRQAFDMTPFARGQLLARARVPAVFADTLESLDAAELLRENIRTLLPRANKTGLLVREVKSNIKAFLSPAYKCLDNALFFDTFVQESLKVGMVPYQGNVTDTRAFASFVDPEIVELTPGEYVLRGLEMRGSDYGRGAQELNAMFVRLLCFNGLTGYDIFRKIHIGRRFTEEELGDGVVELSNKTKRLDVETVRSGLVDVISGTNGQGGAKHHLAALTESVRAAAEADVDVSQTLSVLKKKGLKAASLEKVRELYENEALPVEALPQAPGAWRLSNALSLLANNTKDGDEAADLRDAAYTVLPIPTKQ